jgi:hypothetical protein
MFCGLPIQWMTNSNGTSLCYAVPTMSQAQGRPSRALKNDPPHIQNSPRGVVPVVTVNLVHRHDTDHGSCQLALTWSGLSSSLGKREFFRE